VRELVDQAAVLADAEDRGDRVGQAFDFATLGERPRSGGSLPNSNACK
jgi:hypothetical protein